MIRQEPDALNALILTAVQGLKRLFGACIAVREKVSPDGCTEAMVEDDAEKANKWNLCEPDAIRGKVSEVRGKAEPPSIDPHIYGRDNIRVLQTNSSIPSAASTNMTRNLAFQLTPRNNDPEDFIETVVQAFTPSHESVSDTGGPNGRTSATGEDHGELVYDRSLSAKSCSARELLKHATKR